MKRYFIGKKKTGKRLHVPIDREFVYNDDSWVAPFLSVTLNQTVR